ncbi:MAG: aminotransferase [Candidatus Poribacteria bacterium]|nr:MAG: aminotransferase [Candidatus Poribacteria bacterium]
MGISRKAAGIQPSATLAISAKARQLKAQGVDVIGFGAGEPDFDTPEHIKAAAKRALDEGFTKYTPAAGIPELRQELARQYSQAHNREYSPNQVVVSCGGKHALYNIFQAICDPGDEVIFAAPYWVSYIEMVRLADAKPVVLPTTAEENFTLTPEAIREALTDRTKAIILNSPSNPTGTMYSRAQLEAIAELALERNVYVVADEIYDRLVYDGEPFVSIATLREGMERITLIVNAVSKTYSMTGWRVGWVLAPEEIARAIGNIQSHSTSNPTSFAQKAALAAITGPQDCVEEMRRAFEERRNVICRLLDEIPGVRYARPQGAFYVFPDLSSYYGRTLGGREIRDSLSLTEYLLDTVQVAVVPGEAFGEDRCIRLSFATSMENIQRGLERIRKALAEG